MILAHTTNSSPSRNASVPLPPVAGRPSAQPPPASAGSDPIADHAAFLDASKEAVATDALTPISESPEYYALALRDTYQRLADAANLTHSLAEAKEKIADKKTAGEEGKAVAENEWAKAISALKLAEEEAAALKAKKEALEAMEEAKQAAVAKSEADSGLKVAEAAAIKAKIVVKNAEKAKIEADEKAAKAKAAAAGAPLNAAGKGTKHVVELVVAEARKGRENEISIDPDLEGCVKDMLRGVTIGEADLFPLSFHTKAEFFDSQKLLNYSSQSIQDEKCRRTEMINGGSVEEFSKNFSSSMGGDISLAPAMAPAAKSELNVSYQTNEVLKKTMTFSQHRLQIYHKCLELPVSALLNGSEQRGKLRDLLVEDVRESIDRISSYPEAKDFLELNGFLYVQKAYIGGSIVTTTKTVSQSIFQNRVTDTTFNAIKLGNSKTGVDVQSDQSQSSVSSFSKYSRKKLGGEPIEDDNEWFKSLDKNRSIIQCHFKPIYNLAIPNSRAENWLMRAHAKYFKPIQSGEVYYIVNEQHNVRINIGDDGTPSLLGVQDILSRNILGGRVKVISWDEDLEENKMDVALAHADGHYYFGRHLVRRSVKISNKSYMLKKRNRWHLQRVKDNIFLIRSVVGDLVLGVEGTDSFEFRLVKRSEEKGSRYEDDFKWRFTTVANAASSVTAFDDAPHITTSRRRNPKTISDSMRNLVF